MSIGKSRDSPIQSLRGIAVILMVAGHVIGNAPDRGIQVPDDSAWRFLYLALEDIRMPLFTVLSGFVYAYRPVKLPSDYQQLIRGKSRRLLLPLATVGTLFFLVQLTVPGTNSKPDPLEYWRIFFFSYEHLWFLQAIFLLFLTTGALDYFHVLDKRFHWAAVTALSGFCFIFAGRGVDFFSISGAIRLLPFFLIGYGLNRHVASLSNRGILFLFGSFIITFALKVAFLLAELKLGDFNSNFLSLVVGATATSLMVLARRKLHVSAMSWLGSFAYTIYLLHVFGSAGMRLLLSKFGVDSDGVIFLFSLLAALLLPVVFEKTFGRSALISQTFLGKKNQSSKPARGSREKGV